MPLCYISIFKIAWQSVVCFVRMYVCVLSEHALYIYEHWFISHTQVSRLHQITLTETLQDYDNLITVLFLLPSERTNTPVTKIYMRPNLSTPFCQFMSVLHIPGVPIQQFQTLLYPGTDK